MKIIEEQRWLISHRHDLAKRSGIDIDDDQGWLRRPIRFLLAKLREKVGELELKVIDYDQLITTTFRTFSDEDRALQEKVRFEAAGVATLAMMVAERCGAYDNLPKMPRVVCLCGSTRFKDAFLEANFRETMAGHIVLSVGFFAHADAGKHQLTVEEKTALAALHQRKIDFADEILVLNIGGYMGESTRSEIEHAYLTGKAVRYLELPLLACDGQHAVVVPCRDAGCWRISPPPLGAAG